ncbi:hypothetical protein E4U42_003320 [Claviceps africana]|uniref:Zinc finger PHD-type domain-containing protein n=1 Tax=Claviceps africana TaxID=83212 RepID=A0A8K0JCV9_9HYPO|nr:hypothetical protein E4U42_003320 [Claviceps africana]
MDQTSDADDSNGTSTMLSRMRNMWQFANLCQWIYLFGKAIQIDESIDIEELEMECLKSQSKVLSDIAFALVKLASLRQGLTFDALDDQLRKQYLINAPDLNPLGDENNPLTFASLDVFQKIQVLQTLTQWAMIHPERIRDKMIEQKDTEQTDWRIEPYGWDSQDRVYYVLDDNRVYRFTEPRAPKKNPTPKSTKLNQRKYRASRRHLAASSNKGTDECLERERPGSFEVDDGLGGGLWECVAVTLKEVRHFLETLSKSRDENERILRRRIQKHLLPILEKQEELTRRKQMQRERELLNLSKLANAKRSSRIADKAEKQRQEEGEREQRRQKQEAEEAERREKLAQMKAEQEREFRAFSRHQRLKERELRRRQHTEDLAQLSEGSKSAAEATRMSERQAQAEIERKRQALKEIEQEEQDWVFDCICGLYGQIDDGTHSVACESCSIWQHSKCLGISEQEAEQPEFHFTCKSCRRRGDQQSQTPKTVIKLKVRPSDGIASVSQSKKPSCPPQSEARAWR